jgi:hypothetical protein
MIQTQFHKTSKRIRTNCGKKWLNNALSSFATKKGIQWELTAPYSPDQNGVAERANRTIISRARTMLIAISGLPKSLWAEAIATMIYLTNRSPIKTLPKDKIPHEMLYGTIPRYRYIKTFGCAAYVLKSHAKQEGKMEPRSEKLWLLGYEATTIFRDGIQLGGPYERVGMSISMKQNWQPCLARLRRQLLNQAPKRAPNRASRRAPNRAPNRHR